MGHRDISTTMEIYAEATKEAKAHSFANLNGKLGISVWNPLHQLLHHFYTKLPVSCGELRRELCGSRKKEAAWIGL